MRHLAPVLFPLLCLALFGGCVRRTVTLPPPEDGQPLVDPPAGKVEVQFLADDERSTWTVHTQGQAECSTPCTRVMDAAEPFLLTTRGAEVEVSGLDLEAPGAKRAVVIAEGQHRGKRVNGIVFTTLGGMGAVIAITLSAVGCSNVAERGGMCTAGLITGGVSVPLTAAAIWMLVSSGPQAHVLPVVTLPAARGETPVQVAVTPTGLVGTF